MVAVPKSVTGNRRVRRYFQAESEATAYLYRVKANGFESADIQIEKKPIVVPDARKSQLRDSPTKIESLYAWIGITPDGKEEILALSVHGIQWPLIDSNLDRIEAFRGNAETIEKLSGHSVLLVIFDRAGKIYS